MTDIFTDEQAARAFFESRLWPEGAVCPHCESINAYRMRAGAVRRGLWRCRDCRKQFTVTVGTIFEDTRVPLNKWLLAIHTSQQTHRRYLGRINASHIKRTIGCSYKAAWTMVQRLYMTDAESRAAHGKETTQEDRDLWRAKKQLREIRAWLRQSAPNR